METSQSDVHASIVNSIKEYLLKYNFVNTLECFEVNFKQKETLFRKNTNPDGLLSYFEAGNKDLFFANWVPQIVSSVESKTTEVLLMIHFILFPINPLYANPGSQKSIDFDLLKDYLKENSDFISQNPELIVYFALPYINNPVEHPKF